jgi:hypothetical protein
MRCVLLCGSLWGAIRTSYWERSVSPRVSSPVRIGDTLGEKENNNLPNLRTRFESFVKTLDGFEDIDAVLRSMKPDGRMRADYLFEHRQIIVEQKTLESNPIEKPQKFADRVMRERGIVAFGRVSTRRIFSGQPDAEGLQRKLMLGIAKTIDDDVAKADKQTRDTRLIFDVPNAVGILVLLNESAEMLAPDVIHYALANSFQKKTEGGALRYKQNDGVILISEAHTVPVAGVPGVSRAYPIFTFTSPQTTGPERGVAFADMLRKGWAAFNRALLINAELNNVGANSGTDGTHPKF